MPAFGEPIDGSGSCLRGQSGDVTARVDFGPLFIDQCGGQWRFNRYVDAAVGYSSCALLVASAETRAAIDGTTCPLVTPPTCTSQSALSASYTCPSTAVSITASRTCTGLPDFAFSATVTGTIGGGSGGETPSWTWNSGLESWAFTTSSGTATGDRITSDGSPDNGALRFGAFNNASNQGYFEWSGTWEDLGVPAGSVIDGVTMTGLRTKAVTLPSGTSGTFDGVKIYDSGNVLRTTLWSGRTPSAAETSWTTSSGTEQAPPPAIENSDDTIKIRIHFTGDGGGLEVQMYLLADTLELEIAYS